jgi:predicted site-specific integrase-resolvase
MQSASPNNPSEAALRGHDLLDQNAAAEFLGLSPNTLSVWRSTGRYRVPFLKVGHLVRYRRADLEAWLQTRTRPNGQTE